MDGDKALVAMKEHLGMAQGRMKNFADQSQRELAFSSGGWSLSKAKTL